MTQVTPFSSAGIILSYTCSSRCRHCLYNCSNQWTGWMEPSLLKAIYRGTRSVVRSVRGFHLAGGEAFLNFPLLCDAVRLTGEAGIPLDYVETNAHWFTNHDAAVEKLTALRSAGLDCLLISCSPFHAEYIPFRKTLGAIKASLAVFGRQGTFVWLPEFLQQLTALGVSETISFDEYAQAVGERGAHFAAHYGGQLVAAGRSPYRLSAYLATKSLEECFNESCAHELLHCGFGHYDLYGNIIPCSCSGISLGNAADLGEFTRTFSLDDHPVLHALVTHGVKGLYAMAVAEYGYNPLERYAGKCHLCGDIRKHLVASGAQLSELAPRDYYAQV